jgi:hypothetical protein
VASRRSGAAEKVADGETGFVVEPEVAALAGAFEALKTDALTARLGREAYDRYWQAPLTLAAHALSLLALYRRIGDEYKMRQCDMSEGAAEAAVVHSMGRTLGKGRLPTL